MPGPEPSSAGASADSTEHKRPASSVSLSETASTGNKRQKLESATDTETDSTDSDATTDTETETNTAAGPSQLVEDSKSTSIAPAKVFTAVVSRPSSSHAPVPKRPLKYGPWPFDKSYRAPGGDVVIRALRSDIHYIFSSGITRIQSNYFRRVVSSKDLTRTPEGLPIIIIEQPDYYLRPALYFLYGLEPPVDCDLANPSNLRGAACCAISLGYQHPVSKFLPALDDPLASAYDIGRAVTFAQQTGWSVGCEEAYAASLRLTQAQIDELTDMPGSPKPFSTFQDRGLAWQYRHTAITAALQLVSVTEGAVHINFEHERDFCFYKPGKHIGRNTAVLVGSAKLRVPCAPWFPAVLRILAKALQDRPSPETALDLVRYKYVEKGVKCCEICKGAVEDDLERFSKLYVVAYKVHFSKIRGDRC